MYVIVVGAGAIGSQVIELAIGGGNEVVVIERDEDIADEAAGEYDCLVLHADATTAKTLEDAGADRADAIISTTDVDATNIMVMLLAQELGIPSLVSVVHDPEHMGVFRKIGVNVLENPQRLIAEYLYRAVQRPAVEDFMHLAGGAEIFEITVGRNAPIAGKTLQTADREGLLDEDVLVVAVERNSNVLTPKGGTEIRAGDIVSVFSKRGFAPDVMRTFSSEVGR
jgi:trk system potassium uptake protein TrkA